MKKLSITLLILSMAFACVTAFANKTAFDHFARGNLEMGAQVSVVTDTLGASADADYDKGVAVFTIAGGGLMDESSVAGQKFKYNAKQVFSTILNLHFSHSTMA